MRRPSIVALAGQRVDAPGRPTPRFPPERVAAVSARIRATLLDLQAAALVCSAACGADLLALEEARALGIRRCVVLPFDARRFRETSVADRPGGWDALFDRMLRELGPAGDVETMSPAGNDGDGYAAANIRILEIAQSLAAADSTDAIAVVVWDRDAADWYTVTERFIDEARRRALPVVEVPVTSDPDR